VEKVAEVIDTRLKGIPESSSIWKAVQTMERLDIRIAPVTRRGRLVGILRKEEIKSFVEREISVKIVMEDSVSVGKEDSIIHAARIMAAEGLSRIPVVDDRKRLRCIGTIAATDIVRRMERSRGGIKQIKKE
jgi:CBS domain-containing protein